MVSRVERGPVADWFWTIDRLFMITFILLMGIGFMLSFAASPAVAERLNLDSFHFVKRHAAFLLPALGVMIGLSFLSPRQVRRTAMVILAVSLLMMVAALFFGVEVKGARRWITIAGISVQPSEFMKPAFVVICAWLFAEHARQPEIPGNLFAIILFGIVAALLIAQPDLGQTILVSAVWGGMFFMAGMPWLWITLLGSIGIAGVFGAYLTLPHVAGRIDRFLTGEGDTFQVDTARQAIIRGDWFGQGPGEGIVKRIIPDSHTDFIFSVAAEEFGIFFCMVLVSIFAFLVIRGLSHAFKERNDFNRFAVAGLVLLIGTQSMINIGVNLELLPAKGMTLPLISYGGSSMIAICVT
ncbi:MAG: putative lipid II flippase FtsW, partial [Allorhizobium sp.]